MKPAFAALACLALVACGRAAPEYLAAVSVRDAWCRPTPNGVDVGGCYLTLTSSRDDRLAAVSSPRSPDVQIHTMSMEGGMMRMAELPDGLPLPAGEATRLAPGGNHLMLMRLPAPLVEGQTVSLTLAFETAPDVTVQAEVRQPTVPSGHAGH